MRKILTFLFLVISVQVFGQTYPITGITISLPANPDANTANWGSGISLFTITANSKAANGRVDGHVTESKILVTIKKGGAKVCGSFTANSAPASNFNTLTKVWSGSNAVSLLGQGCVLPSGEYEICVQFFGYGAASPAPLSEEKCKTFSIRAKEQLSYQQPQAIAPANGAILSEIDIKKPLTFRWTPLVPRPQEPVTYRLKVWQLMQGQNGAQAMAANQPIITKDVDNLTQTVITNLISGPCKPPYLCDFIWNVQALNREGKPVGGNNGMSESAQFSANSCDVNLIMKLQSVECLPATQGNNNYKICMSATYNSSTYNLTYANAGSGFKAYNPSYSPFYGISNITPALQVQNNGAATTVNYCFDVIVPVGQTAIKVGLQGDDKDPGPIVCQPGAELDVQLPICDVGCKCGSWNPLTVQTSAGAKRYDCGSTIPWSCKEPFKFTSSYQCKPNTDNCKAKVRWTITKDGSPYSSGTGATSAFTPTANGTYTITLDADCNGVKCPPCTYTIVVTDCCQTSKIIIKKQNTTIPNDGSCIKPGTYSFNLNITPSTPTVSGTYVLTAMPNNVPPVSSGSFTSGTPINLTIPEYVCGSVTGFKLTYTWNHAKCSSTIERAICPPPCCDNITLKKTNKLLTGTDLDFTTQFSILPSATFTKVKVQILDINVSGAAKPWANILSLNESTWGAGTTNSAITTPGNAIWFSGSLLANGPLTFSGKIINIFGMATTNTVNLVLRFTFYQNNGSCSEIICEKDISFNNGIGPKQSDK